MIEAESREEYQTLLEDEDDQSPSYMMKGVMKEMEFIKVMVSWCNGQIFDDRLQQFSTIRTRISIAIEFL